MGSDLIFAGPHKTFTNVNKPRNINHVISGMYSTTRKLEYSDVSCTDEPEYTIITNSDLGLVVDPYLLNPDDLLDVGWQVVPDFEDLVESQNHIMEEHESIGSQH